MVPPSSSSNTIKKLQMVNKHCWQEESKLHGKGMGKAKLLLHMSLLSFYNNSNIYN